MKYLQSRPLNKFLTLILINRPYFIFITPYFFFLVSFNFNYKYFFALQKSVGGMKIFEMLRINDGFTIFYGLGSENF